MAETAWQDEIPSRPRVAYIYFVGKFSEEFRANGGEMKQLMKAAGEAWKELDDSQKKVLLDPRPFVTCSTLRASALFMIEDHFVASVLPLFRTSIALELFADS